MSEHKKVLIQGIGLGFAVVGFGGFAIGTTVDVAPWLLIGVSASIIAVSLLSKDKSND